MSKKRSFQDSDIDDSNEPPEKKRRLDDDSIIIEDEDEVNEDIDGESDIESDDWSQIVQLIKNMVVLKYSTDKLKETQKQYAQEQDAITRIPSADPLSSDDYDTNNELINKHKLWTHCIPTEILKLIFERCIFHEYDRTVLNLVKVCKSWRDIIISIDPETNKELFALLWNGCISSRNMKHAFCWKDLVLIPQKYLALIHNLYQLEDMSNEENIKYRQLCVESEGGEIVDENILLNDTNVPLYIQVLKHCPKLCSMELHGRLCKDLFIVLTDYANCVHHIEFSYCDCPDFVQILGILGLFHSEGKALANLISIKVECGWIQFDLSLFCEHFRDIESISLQKKYVGADDLYVMFNNCTKLREVMLWKCTSEDGDWIKAFKCLTEKHQAIEHIEIIGINGFDDDCCELFLNKNACPNLKELALNYSLCSQEMIVRLKEARKDIDVEIETLL